MKIAISGAHSQGKTTIINSLRDISSFKDYKFIDSPTRALQTNFQINENGTQDTQVNIMFNHYLNATTNGSKVVFDRCALDGMAYTMFFNTKINLSIFESLRLMYLYLMQQYDYIFYITPELTPKNDGTRSIDTGFFEEIKSNFNYLIKRDQHKVFALSGSNEQRINTILNTIK